MTLGARLRRSREALGITQTDLAEQSKSSKQTIYKYESGIITNVPSDKIELIAEILRVSPSYLMGWTDNPSTSPNIAELHNDELKLINLYRNLNQEGQEKLIDYSDDLVSSGKYKKDNSDGMGFEKNA